MERQVMEGLTGVRYFGTGDPLPDSGEVVLITNTHTDLGRWTQLRPRTKAVIHPNSGFDNLIDADWSEVPTLLGNEIRAEAVAQWTLAALLQNLIPVRHHSHWPKDRRWDRPLLSSLKVLVIGMGPVGSLISESLAALGATPQRSDPYLGFELSLHQRFDVVILACSLNPSSRHLINEAFLAQQGDDFLLINPARGELVDEKALRDFFRRHPRARAVLDVHAQEPYPANYWSDWPQVIATPHVAGVSGGLIARMLEFEARALRAVLEHNLPTFALLEKRKTSQGYYR